MSKLETNTIDTVSGTSTLQVGSTNTSTITLGVSGDTINVPSGVTINNNGTQTGFGGTNTPAFEVTRGSNQTITNDTMTKVELNVETFDTANAFDSSTNYRFTPQTAGKYYIYAQATCQIAVQQIKRYTLVIRKNGSNYKYMSNYFTDNPAFINQIYIGSTIVFNGSSDYVDLYTKIENQSSGTPQINGDSTELTFGGYKIIE